MARMYGHKWVSAYGERDDGTWASGLAELTLQQLATGVRGCLKRTDPWPPTLPEFRVLCVGEKRPHGAMYRSFKALPRPLADKAKAREQLDIMRRTTGSVKV